MYEIPKPELLNPDRVDRDDRENMTQHDRRSQAHLLAQALGQSCGYADQLWEQVNALRGYLLDSLPPDPRNPGPHTTAAASPAGPDDEDGWRNWINAFAGTTSVLCGAHGDSGFGLSRAREEAQLRRTAPELTLHARRPDLGPPESTPNPTPDPPARAQPLATPDSDRVSRQERTATAIKAAATAVIAVLALRGLRTQPLRAHRVSGPGSGA